MRIEFSKSVKIRTVESIAEVDFLQQSPYIDFLGSIDNEENLRNMLSDKEIEEAAIKNIINNFTRLGVLKDGYIIDLKKGFPEKEYGKYKVYYCENDTDMPFKYRKHSIERIEPVNNNRLENIENISSVLEKTLCNEDDSIEKENFRIRKITDSKGFFSNNSKNTEQLQIVFDDVEDSPLWKHSIKSTIIDNRSIDLNTIFEGKWNSSSSAVETEFSEISGDENALKHFKLSYNKIVNLENYGELKAKFNNIRIIPTEYSYKEWFLYLLKREIDRNNRYITYNETEQIWNNLLSLTPQINKRFQIPFNFDLILELYKKDSELYWLLMAGKDLNPFEKKNTKEIKTVIFEDHQNCNLGKIFDDKLSFNNANEIVIIDRYVNTLRHFKSLEVLLNSYQGKKTVKLITTDFYETTDEDVKKIEEICSRSNITRIVKIKKEIPHDRHWIFDKRLHYIVSKSIDFIGVSDEGNVSLQHTYFNLVHESNIEEQAKNILEGLK